MHIIVKTSCSKDPLVKNLHWLIGWALFKPNSIGRTNACITLLRRKINIWIKPLFSAACYILNYLVLTKHSKVSLANSFIIKELQFRLNTNANRVLKIRYRHHSLSPVDAR